MFKKLKLGSEHIAWGLTAIGVIFVSMLVYFAIDRMSYLKEFAGTVTKILAPIIWGLAMAYLLIPIYNYFFRTLWPSIHEKAKTERTATVLTRGFSTAITVLLAIILISTLVGMILPQVLTSVYGIIESLPQNVQAFVTWAERLVQDNQFLYGPVQNFLDNFEENLLKWFTNSVQPLLTDIVSRITVGVINVFNFMMNIVIGVIVCIYVLNSKETFSAQGKKLIYSIMEIENANILLDNVRLVHQVFGGFISGKILDSAIIGVITFIGLSILKMPYVVMISVVIGVTNIIPFFGPFIGAIPCALIILLVSPLKCLYFIIFIIILQQVDGNIIGPKILGDSTGLSSFWVMFAILVGGGLFGFGGMIVGVPIFAVVYTLISKKIKRTLEKKSLPVATEYYVKVDHIDAETKKAVLQQEKIATDNNNFENDDNNCDDDN